MGNTTSIHREVVMSLITLSLGLFTVWQGWRLVKFPTKAAPMPTYRLAIWLVGIIQGEAAAMSKKAELMKPERLRRSGYYALAAGSCLLVGGGLLVIVLILKIVGF
jgi:hypothetical protein